MEMESVEEAETVYTCAHTERRHQSQPSTSSSSPTLTYLCGDGIHHSREVRDAAHVLVIQAVYLKTAQQVAPTIRIKISSKQNEAGRGRALTAVQE